MLSKQKIEQSEILTVHNVPTKFRKLSLQCPKYKFYTMSEFVYLTVIRKGRPILNTNILSTSYSKRQGILDPQFVGLAFLVSRIYDVCGYVVF